MLNPLPSVSQASSMVLQEEQQRECRTFNPTTIAEPTAFLSHQRPSHFTNSLPHHSIPSVFGQQSNTLVPSQPYYNGPKRPLQQNLVQCSYCHKPRHTIDKCYKLQRLRNDKGQRDRGRRLVASIQQSDLGTGVSDPASGVFSSSSGQHTLTFEQYDQLLVLLGKQNMTVASNLDQSQAVFLAGKSFCLLTTQPDMRWIIDSGATDHITPHLNLFHSYTPISKACSIIMPNGKQVKVQHIGTVILSPDIVLQGVLHVPEFQFNLLSASKLAKHMSSNVVFSPSYCYIQDPLKSKPLVFGEEVRGLYLAKASNIGTLQSPTACLSLSELWHCRLGHPSTHHMAQVQGLPCSAPTTTKNQRFSHCQCSGK